MRLLGLAACAFAVLTAGCAGPTPTLPRSTSSPSTSAVARAQATHEYSSPAPQGRQPADTAATPRSSLLADPRTVVRAFALAYINWNAPMLSSTLHALAAASIGQAHSAMELAAANAAQNYELKRGGIVNSGTVETVAPLAGTRDRYVVVTREQTSATNTSAYQGLHPAWHITLATVTELAPHQWVVSGWQPET